MSWFRRLPGKVSLFMFAGVLIVIVLAAFLYLWQERSPVKVGYIGNLTGGEAEWGVSTRNGVLLAIEAVNEAGGIRGHKIELITKDDQQNPKVAAQAVKDLIREGVVAIIGPTMSTAAIGAVPVANEHKMLLISPSVSSEAFTAKDDYLIRTVTLNSRLARDLAGYLYNKKNWRTVAAAIEISNRAYVVDAYKNFRKYFEALGGRVLEPVDGVYLVAYDADTAYICQELRKLGSAVPVAEAGSSLTDALIRHGGPAVEGLVAPHNAFIEAGDKRLEPFRELYRKRFGGEPTNITGYGFDVANVLIEALRQSKVWTPVALKQTILGIKHFRSLFGDFDPDAYGDADRPAVIVVVENGKFVRVP